MILFLISSHNQKSSMNWVLRQESAKLVIQLTVDLSLVSIVDLQIAISAEFLKSSIEIHAILVSTLR